MQRLSTARVKNAAKPATFSRYPNRSFPQGGVLFPQPDTRLFYWPVVAIGVELLALVVLAASTFLTKLIID